jgi:hypothetical protein
MDRIKKEIIKRPVKKTGEEILPNEKKSIKRA